MRCELNQMDRMAAEERFGADAAWAMRTAQDIRRRMRLEATMREDEDETLGDLSGD